MQQRTIQILSVLLLLGLVLWGGYTLLVYLGIPLHAAVLLTDDARKGLDTCSAGDFLCRGTLALVPFITHSLSRLSPFLPYAILSVVIYGMFLGWRFLQTQVIPQRITLRAWHVPLLFIGLLWLVFTTLSYGGSDTQSLRTVYQPTTEAYGNLDEESMAMLQGNFAELEAGGCLSPEGQTAGGTGIYTLSTLCIQTSFVTRVLSQALVIALFLAELLILGFMLLRLLRAVPRSALAEFLFSLGLGAGGWIILLWVAAALGQYTAVVGWGLAIVVPALCYPSILHWFKRLRDTSFEVEFGTLHVRTLLLWLLVSLLAFNFLTVVRPFPIGWDDLGSYLNRPRLLVSFGFIIPQMSTFQWEYLTSLGFLLFGYDSIFGATASMLINWSAGLLAVLAVYGFGSLFLGRGRGILAALLYYALPLVGHFSFADMKIDNAVFFMGALATLAAFAALFPVRDDDQPDEGGRDDARVLLLLSGLFCGLAFAFKITSVMLVFSLLTLIVGVYAGGIAFLGCVFFMLIFLGLEGRVSLTDMFHAAGTDTPVVALVLGTLAIAGIVCLGVGLYQHRASLRTLLLHVGLWGIAAVIVMLPWLGRNAVLHGALSSRILGAPNTLAPRVNITVPREAKLPDELSLPPALALNPNDPACKAPVVDEELDRYWGFGTGWSHYFTLPWRSVMNVDAGGYYVTTMPALLLLPLVFLLAYCWTRRGRWLRWLTFSTLFILLQWMFLANGVPWYGIGMFLGLVLGLEGLVAEAPDVFSRSMASLLIGLSLLMSFAQRTWQFEQQRNLLEYPMGKVSAEALRERTIPHYDNIRDIVLERQRSMPDHPYLYRMGTFIPYFIPKSLVTMPLADNQLQIFNCLYQERDPALTVRRLKELGFNSMIFDTNTATIESDQNGTLHQKVNAFVEFVNSPASHIRIVINDPEGGVAFMLLPDDDLPPEDVAPATP